jgi:uncharacterized membrane protein
MKLNDYKLIFIAIGLIGVLLIASPALADLLHFPSGEQFSELYLLGPNQMAANIPFNIAAGQNYSVYLGVGNHLGASAYYVCYVKLRNQTDPSPNDITQTASSLAPLYEYRTFVQNGVNWTVPLTFSLSGVSISNNQSMLGSITINNAQFDIGKIAQLDQKNNGYYYQLFIELWAFNPSDTLQYQNRYVYFWMNVTSTA